MSHFSYSSYQWVMEQRVPYTAISKSWIQNYVFSKGAKASEKMVPECDSFIRTTHPTSSCPESVACWSCRSLCAGEALGSLEALWRNMVWDLCPHSPGELLETASEFPDKDHKATAFLEMFAIRNLWTLRERAIDVWKRPWRFVYFALVVLPSGRETSCGTAPVSDIATSKPKPQMSWQRKTTTQLKCGPTVRRSSVKWRKHIASKVELLKENTNLNRKIVHIRRVWCSTKSSFLSTKCDFLIKERLITI